MTEIAISKLESLCHTIFERAGVRQKDRDILVAHLVGNEVCGKASHGMVRVLPMVKHIEEEGVSTEDPIISLDNSAVIKMDGRGQLGMVACHYATEMAAERANTYGISFCGITHYFGNTGAMATYMRMLADKGLIGICGCNSDALVAPPGGKQPVHSTNPLGICFPGEKDDCFIADVAMTSIAYGTILKLGAQGLPVPEGVLIDKNGKASTHPKDADEGAILPLAGYKGFAMAMLIELLGGAVLTGQAGQHEQNWNYGFFCIALDPAKLGDPKKIRRDCQAYFDFVRNSTPLDLQNPVTIPGDRSKETAHKNISSGTLIVADSTLNKLIKASS